MSDSKRVYLFAEGNAKMKDDYAALLAAGNKYR